MSAQFEHPPRFGAPPSRIRERRRRRLPEWLALPVGVAGVVLHVLARADILPLLPAAWHPYVIGGSAVALALGVGEIAESRRDYRRYLKKVSGEMDAIPAPNREA